MGNGVLIGGLDEMKGKTHFQKRPFAYFVEYILMGFSFYTYMFFF